MDCTESVPVEAGETFNLLKQLQPLSPTLTLVSGQVVNIFAIPNQCDPTPPAMAGLFINTAASSCPRSNEIGNSTSVKILIHVHINLYDL